MIDVTMATMEAANIIRKWRVHPDDFSSDQAASTIEVTMATGENANLVRNWRVH